MMSKTKMIKTLSKTNLIFRKKRTLKINAEK